MLSVLGIPRDEQAIIALRKVWRRDGSEGRRNCGRRYRLSSYVPAVAPPAGTAFNQFLILAAIAGSA